MSNLHPFCLASMGFEPHSVQDGPACCVDDELIDSISAKDASETMARRETTARKTFHSALVCPQIRALWCLKCGLVATSLLHHLDIGTTLPASAQWSISASSICSLSSCDNMSENGIVIQLLGRSSTLPLSLIVNAVMDSFRSCHPGESFADRENG
jgi:hypothetical protein